jgi:Tfp pilus assembly protein PilX
MTLVRSLPSCRTTLSYRQAHHVSMARPSRRQDERGASLILALIFLLVISVTALSLTTWSTNSLNNVAKFGAPAAARSAVDGAVETAVQGERYNVTPTSITSTPSSTPAICSTVTIPENSVNYTFTIWCGTVQDLGSSATRVVTFNACSGPATGSVCASPQLVASVTYDDYTFPISQVLTSYCKKNCGTSVTVSSWVVSLS